MAITTGVQDEHLLNRESTLPELVSRRERRSPYPPDLLHLPQQHRTTRLLAVLHQTTPAYGYRLSGFEILLLPRAARPMHHPHDQRKALSSWADLPSSVCGPALPLCLAADLPSPSPSPQLYVVPLFRRDSPLTSLGLHPAHRSAYNAHLDVPGDSSTQPDQLPLASDPEQNDDSSQAETALASPIEITHDAQFDVPWDRSNLPGFHVNDFNGRQVHVPLERCTSWEDLRLFLVAQLNGQGGSHFVTSGSFGLLAPKKSELLSSDTWVSWVVDSCNGHQGQNITLELYAIITDDSDRCPKCSNLVTHPLPDNLQRCALVECQFTFLVVYREAGVNLPDVPRTENPPLAESPEQSAVPSELVQQRIIEPSHSVVSSATEVESAGHTAEAVPGRSGGRAASDLFGSLLVAMLQISSSGNDPIVHTLALLSMVCLFAGAGYAATLVITFGKLETETDRHVWIRATHVMPKNSFWNPWIMLAMPLAWIGWGVFYGVVLVGAFIWREGATNEPDENSRLSAHQAYGPKVVEMLTYLVALGYFGLIVKTVRGIDLARIL
ncbi:hypothetical protein B0H13DRAFT_2317853 [Mycena leptocephala]|nr:hypothetical protein B0H13DRAFT_2317853 [Mycena leptocephala]